jgi:hypothetical protein
MSPELFLKLFNRIRKQFFVAVFIIFLGGLLTSYPNTVTHKCVPNFRTQMGLSSDGYPYEKRFCPEGYYPQLKWGEGQAASRALEIFLFILPVLFLLPLTYMLLAKRHKNQ